MNDSRNPWFLRLLTLLVWGLAVLSASFWTARLIAPTPAKPKSTDWATAPTALDPALLMRALGATPEVGERQVTAASRYSLVGVIADRSQHGTALIAVQGMPARPFRVGSRVDTGLVLQSVGKRSVSLGDSVGAPSAIALEMPALQ